MEGIERVLEFLDKANTYFLATAEGDQPRVRPFSSVAEFEGNAYICCGNYKEIYKQLSANPKIELCGMYDGGTWLRVSATVVEDNRVEVQKAVLDDPTGPKQLYTAGDGRFVTYKLTEVKALKYNFYAAPEEIKEHD